MRRATTVLGLTALLALTGCGATDAPEEVVASTVEDPLAASQDPGEDTSYPTQTDDACDVLSQRIAKTLLGSVGDAARPPPPTTDEDVTLTSCVRSNALADRDTPTSVSLLMRVARSVTGARGNESVFAPGALPSGALKVPGYGQAAFWNPAFGQLNILKNGNWYILASGPIDPRKHTLAQTRSLADAIIGRL
jgi:hypothetical protein